MFRARDKNWILLLAVIWLSLCESAAHKLSDSFLKIDLTTPNASSWEIALRDLEYAVGLDQNDDLQITWGEVRARIPEIQEYAARHLRISVGEQNLSPVFTGLAITDHSDGKHAVLSFSLPEFPAGQEARIQYDLLFEVDLQHRGFLRLISSTGETMHLFSPENRSFSFQPGHSGSSAFPLFFREGIWHIWKGIDHVLFLFALLLPAVLVRKSGRWEAVGDARSMLWHVLRVITAFTIAHSITLTLATLNLIYIPAGIIEPIIAASVVFAALNNVFGWFQDRLWSFAFGFGLVHGFGFAFVLQDLGLSQGALFTSLLGFNLGVEAGQLAIVAAVLPLAFLFRSTIGYRRFVLQYGSVAIALVATTWMLERMFEFKVLPF